jgi:hypothetical protein
MVAADESKVINCCRVYTLLLITTKKHIQLSKSATLRKAIDHINFLRSQNADLLKANQCLRRTLDTGNKNGRLFLKNQSFFLSPAGIPLPTNLTKVEVAAPAPFDAKGNVCNLYLICAKKR